jgi:5-methylthioadenosine/S-adenosylhomocysteine deaminase
VYVRNLGTDQGLLNWLEQVIWPAQAAMTADDARLAAQVGLLENVRCGVTTVIDHQKLVATPEHTHAVLEAAEAIGVRLVLARAWAEQGAGAETADAVLYETEKLVQRWHGAARGRLRVALGPLAPWRCSRKALQRTMAAARAWGIGTHIHVAETQAEVQMTLDAAGRGHVEWLEDAGALGPDVQLIHAIWLSEAELERVAATGSVVVHCPVSNAYLGSGIAPVKQMRARGISVALGTDGPGSNNSQDMFETMKAAALLQKAHHLDAKALGAASVLQMATRGGAQASGWSDIGRLEAGAKADLILVSQDAPRLTPLNDPAAALVYAASAAAVDGVIIDGQAIMRDGRLVSGDEASLLEECRQAARRLRARLGDHTRA